MSHNRDSSDDEDDTFVTIGTPLSTYSVDEAVVRKPVGLHEQAVRDEQGRLRFHGAFTGGFSAGYFNTVGSKEGWVPKTFVSSRSERFDAGTQQKPEDFMDEEDFGEFGIAPKVIATKENFASNERERKRKADLSSSLVGESIITGAESVLVDLVLPRKTTVGIRLLRKLGWKEGQGVGPRTRKKRRRKRDTSAVTGQKVYGCALPPAYGSEDSEVESPDEFHEDVTFAPKDVCLVSFEPKNNNHGIGYRGLDPKSALGHTGLAESAGVTTSGRRGIRGQAFGVGAFENEDDDIYGVESMVNYDTVLGDELPASERKNFGWTAPKHISGDKSSLAVRGITYDVLPGFTRAAAPSTTRKHYPPPQLPRDFKPFHKFDSDSSSISQSDSARGKNDGKKLDTYSRGAALGEAPHLKSVFELVSSEDQAKMEAAKMQADVAQCQQLKQISSAPDGASLSDKACTESRAPDKGDSLVAGRASSTSSQTVSILSQKSVSTTAATAVSSQPSLSSAGFTPFAKNPAKQKRYEAYLEAVKAGTSHVPTDGIHTTEWEREREREEFAQAARLYRPVSAMIASRFTRAKYDDDDDKAVLPADNSESENSRAKAASMKMFGKLTRDTVEWHPDKLLCKRFNIANPYPDSSIVGLSIVKREKYSVFNFLSFPSQEDVEPDKQHQSEQASAPPVKEVKTHDDSPSGSRVKPLAILATVDLRPKPVGAAPTPIDTMPTAATDSQATVNDDEPNQAPLPASDVESSERPPMDLFKAIFENSEPSSSSSEASDDEDKQDKDADSATAAINNTASDIAPAAVSNTAPLSLQHPTQQQDSDDRVAAVDSLHEADDSTEKNLQTAVMSVSGDCQFGPAVPPSSISLDVMSVAEPDVDSKHHRLQRQKHHLSSRHRHKHDKEKRAKHNKKKLKKKKKDKKSKKKRKKPTELKPSSSSSSDADVEDSGSETSEHLSSLDQRLLSRLRSLPAHSKTYDIT